MVHEFKWEALLEVGLGRRRSTRASARWPVSALACAAGNCGVRSPGQKPKRCPFHPGSAGEEKTGGKLLLPGPAAASGRRR
jgi:hypothetical protein